MDDLESDSWNQNSPDLPMYGMLRSFIHVFNHSADFGVFQSNGIDLDMGKINDLNLSDKQRSTAIKISEVRRQIATIKERISKARVSNGVPNSMGIRLDGPSTADNVSRDTRPSGDDKMTTRLQKLEAELDNLESELDTSLGADRASASRKRRLELASQFDCGSDDAWDEILDQSNSIPEYHDIPRAGKSENSESVANKLRILRMMENDAQSSLSDNQSEKKLNELAQEDEDIDPLEAFMAENSIELANQQMERSQAKLDAIRTQIHVFERLHALLSKNQFADQNLSAALEQRRKLESERKRLAEEQSSSSPATSQGSRGQGTVWEEEFKKDDSVPNRAFAGTSGEKGISAADGSVQLDASIGGLHRPGAAPAPILPAAKPSAQTVKAPRREVADQRQDELRKKLGY